MTCIITKAEFKKVVEQCAPGHSIWDTPEGRFWVGLPGPYVFGGWFNSVEGALAYRYRVVPPEAIPGININSYLAKYNEQSAANPWAVLSMDGHRRLALYLTDQEHENELFIRDGAAATAKGFTLLVRKALDGSVLYRDPEGEED